MVSYRYEFLSSSLEDPVTLEDPVVLLCSLGCPLYFLRDPLLIASGLILAPWSDISGRSSRSASEASLMLSNTHVTNVSAVCQDRGSSLNRCVSFPPSSMAANDTICGLSPAII